MELFEHNPSTKVNLSKELASGQGLIVLVPAAFSPGCSDSHVPGYFARPDKLEKNGVAGKTFIVAVNDAFVYVYVQPALSILLTTVQHERVEKDV